MRRALRWGYRCVAATVAVSAVLAIAFELVVRARAYPVELLHAGFRGSLRIEDAGGQLLREVVNGDGARARWTPLDSMSPLAVTATIAVEDARFYDHEGIDPVGVGRAIVDNVQSGRVVSGASTLTMQLARLVEPHPKTLGGKLGEMVDARRIERAVDKRTILEQYMNRAPYGAGSVGLETASLRYFGKPSLHLSLAEAALLAGLPKAPSLLNPLVNPSAARERQRHVLDRMLETSAITPAAYEQAIAEPLAYRNAPPPLVAMHFTDFVMGRLRDGAEPARRRAPAVRTSLDRDLQLQVERTLADHVDSLALGGATNAAAIVLDNRSCAILAMVGSADYWDERGGAVNGATALRQPGSALKPFTYALAFEAGDTPASVVADIETRYGDAAGELFVPTNYDEAFAGPVLMGAALGRSLNVPAIRVANRVGPRALLRRLRALGFDSLDRSAAFYGLGLTLGNGEVTLVEMATAYAALARGGMSCRATPFANDTASGERVFSEQVAYLVTDVLTDERLRIAAFGPSNALLLGFPVAVKTGTSSNWRDNWAVGYTDRYTIGVWVGDFEGKPMNHLAGAAGAGPLFHRITKLAVARDGAAGRPELPRPPAGIADVAVCAVSGRLPSEHCPHPKVVHVQADRIPTETCDWHTEVTLDRRNGLRAGPSCPDTFVDRRVFESLPPLYTAWQAEHARAVPPAAYSPLCPADGPSAGSALITAPRDGEVFLIEPGYDRATQTLELAAQVDGAAEHVSYFVDGEQVASAAWPYRAVWQLAPGRHELEVRSPGKRGHTIAFEVR